MTNDKKSTSRAKKEVIVAELKDNLSKSKGLVLTNYQGLTHKQIEDLKKALRPLSAYIVIAKNTLLLRAISDSQFSTDQFSDSSPFQHPTATIFLQGDPIAPLKHLAKIIKELNLPKIKIGIIEGRVLESDEILKLSALPPRDMLIAQIVGGFKTPLYGLHRALNWNLQKLVMTLKTIETKKI